MAAISTTTLKVPLPSESFTTPTNAPTRQWYYLLIGLWNRTGGAPGISSAVVQAEAEAAQTTANTALGDATAAQAAANAAQTSANAAQTSANTANAAVAAETTRAEAAEALRALVNDPTFTGSPPIFPLFPAYANDAAAATGGIVVGQFYWSSTLTAVVQRRV